ncbi:S8 family serine peptidase [Roseicella frigidaeris]|uniref:Regulatory P domain of subtilisin-like proprotein convertase n=1 Tax=Roseicella frigidaeris TaxID=2230885 RepID=A0A327MCA8_9PROT|nr:S8 family serine peptidase [Roseicella frigidaeris]RAI59814.1 regulatory P domain of subtilisin-like proprotein convertase [Roseicella frigidaeris]
MTDSTPTDPLFRYQWGLQNTGQANGGIGIDINVLLAWDDYTGRGVRVGVIDSGVQLDHPDLRQNIDPSATWDAAQDQPGGDPLGRDENHGTAVAGIIAAASNDIGGVGVAPDATLGVYHVGFGANLPFPVRPDQFTIAFQHALADGMDIVNNSWGATVPFALPEEGTAALIEQGRNGLGTIIVFANGNGRADGDDGVLELQLDLPYVISVGAVQNNGVATGYSTPGADLLISAPGGAQTDQSATRPGNGIATTDRTGTDGYNTTAGSAGDYTYDFNGTSAATPFVSGVVALMLEANPGLGYRDVQEILSASARLTDEAATGWITNTAGTWNGGGRLFNRDYGFGLVDAHAAVRLAESYIGREAKTAANTLTYETAYTPPSAVTLSESWTSIPLHLTGSGTVEHVSLALHLDTPNAANLAIELVSPTGTRIPLLQFAKSTETVAWPEGGFTLTTPGFWGEKIDGTWRLAVLSLNEDPAVVEHLVDATIEVSAAAASTVKEFVYTDDFPSLAAEDSSRLIVTSPTNQIAINAAAVTGDVILDLPAHTLSVDGTLSVINPAAHIVEVYGGDGNDALYGDAGDTVFMPGRGANVTEGGGGHDIVKLLRPLDAYADVASGERVMVAGPHSLDTISGVATLQFSDGSIALGSNPMVRGLYYAQHNADVYASGIAADLHYATEGWQQGRDPNPWFSTTSYLANHKDVQAMGVNPLDYYAWVGWQRDDDPSAGFDGSLYLHFNPDVAAAGLNPLLHWLQYGQAEGRDIYPVIDGARLRGDFDPTFYSLANPDVAAAGVDPMLHWQEYGWREGRDPNAYFDTDFYLTANTDVAAAHLDPLLHYQIYGWREGRDPSAAFDTDSYLHRYADVAAAGVDPLLHFLSYGVLEGRTAEAALI